MSKIISSFTNLGLKNSILNALSDLGYKKPSPIQSSCIPYLLSGYDVLGIAQTGTGKTAAFSLPLLHNIDLQIAVTQMLILTPTRELALQDKEACINFTKYMKKINIVAIYGGQHFNIQLNILRQGPQVIVGTPGRLLDHLRRGTINLSNLKSLVLDEADEMLRMGFIEDVESILKNIPTKHQTALFSATLSEEVRKIIYRFMCNPKEIFIKSNITTIPNIQQNYWIVCGIKKVEALMRFLEVENFNAVIIFVRTKNLTTELNKILEFNGYNSSTLNGDMSQHLREQTLNNFKKGNIDILIATDVAARGLDINRIDLVINYDIPIDSKLYTHRIGRTGRAGRAGKSLLFVELWERRLLKNIEKNTKLSKIELPTTKTISDKRITKFIYKLCNYLKSNNDFDIYRKLLFQLLSTKELIEVNNTQLNLETLSIALLKIAQGSRPLIVSENNVPLIKRTFRRYSSYHLYRIEVGINDGVEVRHIVGAIINEVHISNKEIGNIKLFQSYSIIELSKNLDKKIFSLFKKIYIFNKPINISFLPSSKFSRNKKINKNKKIFSKNKLLKKY